MIRPIALLLSLGLLTLGACDSATDPSGSGPDSNPHPESRVVLSIDGEESIVWDDYLGSWWQAEGAALILRRTDQLFVLMAPDSTYRMYLSLRETYGDNVEMFEEGETRAVPGYTSLHMAGEPVGIRDVRIHFDVVQPENVRGWVEYMAGWDNESPVPHLLEFDLYIDDVAGDHTSFIPGDTGGGESEAEGAWQNSNAPGRLHISGSTIRQCNTSTGDEWTGTYDAAAGMAYFTVAGNAVEYEIEVNGDEMITQQYIETQNHHSTGYWHRITSYSCP